MVYYSPEKACEHAISELSFLENTASAFAKELLKNKNVPYSRIKYYHQVLLRDKSIEGIRYDISCIHLYGTKFDKTVDIKGTKPYHAAWSEFRRRHENLLVQAEKHRVIIKKIAGDSLWKLNKQNWYDRYEIMKVLREVQKHAKVSKELMIEFEKVLKQYKAAA